MRRFLAQVLNNFFGRLAILLIIGLCIAFFATSWFGVVVMMVCAIVAIFGERSGVRPICATLALLLAYANASNWYEQHIGSMLRRSAVSAQEEQRVNNILKAEAEARIEAEAEELCDLMGADEPVCQKWWNGDFGASRVVECIWTGFSFKEDDLLFLCLSGQDMGSYVSIKLDMVDWGDGKFEKNHTDALKEWARGIDATGCERGTEELTSVRCALHAAAMAELTPAN